MHRLKRVELSGHFLGRLLSVGILGKFPVIANPLPVGAELVGCELCEHGLILTYASPEFEPVQPDQPVPVLAPEFVEVASPWGALLPMGRN